jgi:hypothetical protein
MSGAGSWITRAKAINFVRTRYLDSHGAVDNGRPEEDGKLILPRSLDS